MSSVRTLLSGLLLVAVVGCGGSSTTKPSEASNKDKIVGTWEVSKGEPAGGTVDFAKDGKMKMTMKMGDKAMSMDGTYAVEGDNLKVTMKEPDGKESSETMKIAKLTDKELVTEEKKGDKTETTEFKKK